MDHSKKMDSSGVMGRRISAYKNDYEDVELLLTVNENKFTEEELDDLSKFVMRAIVAYQGFVKNEQKIGEICGLVSFGIPDRLTRLLGKGIVQKVREAFAYALALVLGYQEYQDTLNFASPYAKEVHFGQRKF
jgi:hypothetical protein